MAIAIDTTAYAQQLNSSSITASYTCTGEDRFLIVSVGGQTTVASGVTYAGVAMTQFGTSLNPAANRRVNSWYLKNPRKGANNIIATFSGSTGWHYLVVSSYTGVDPLNPIITSGDDTGTGTTATIEVTTTAADQWGIYGITYASATASAGTRSYERQDNTEIALYDSNATLPSGATDMNTSLSSSVAWGANYIVIRPTPTYTVSEDLSTDLIAYWKMDETSGTREDIKGSNDLTDNNTVTSATGIINNAADFLGSNSEYLTGNGISYTEGLPMSYNLWINLPSTSQKGIIFEDGGNGGINNGFAIAVGNADPDNNGNNLLVPFWGVAWQNTGVAIGTGWHMLSVTLGSDSKATAYIDGSLALIGTSTMFAFANTILTIGRSNYATAYRYLSDASVDEVGVWSKALTAGDYAALYNSGSGIPYEAATSAVNSGFFNFM